MIKSLRTRQQNAGRNMYGGAQYSAALQGGAVERCQRLEEAIRLCYQDLTREGWLYTYTIVKDHFPEKNLEDFESLALPTSKHRYYACECDHMESIQ